MRNIRVLLYVDRSECIDRRIFQPTDYNAIFPEYYTKGGNSGNKVWLSAIEQYLSQPHISYDYLTEGHSASDINDDYDAIIFPCANRIRNDTAAISDMERWTNEFKEIRIPIYVLGIGMQATSPKRLNELVKKVTYPAKQFIDTVYNTGGDFSLRGYFTAEVFQRLGYHNVYVSGCPSMYSRGRSFQIDDRKVSIDEFKPLINGKIPLLNNATVKRYFHKYEDCVFIDQNSFAELLYSHKYRELAVQNDKEFYHRLLNKYTVMGLKLYSEGRIKLFYDVPIWSEFLRRFNFAFGTRIHGNLLPILNGIPALLYYKDLRTREIADYFDIPHIERIPRNKDLYDLYIETDYDRFNKTFTEKYDRFNKFMQETGIFGDLGNSGDYYRDRVAQIAYRYPGTDDSSIIDFLHRRNSVLAKTKSELAYRIKQLIRSDV